MIIEISDSESELNYEGLPEDDLKHRCAVIRQAHRRGSRLGAARWGARGLAQDHRVVRPDASEPSGGFKPSGRRSSMPSSSEAWDKATPLAFSQGEPLLGDALSQKVPLG